MRRWRRRTGSTVRRRQRVGSLPLATDLPSLSALLVDPDRLDQLGGASLRALLTQVAAEQTRLAALQMAIAARLQTVTNGDGGVVADEGLGVEEAARRLGVSRTWLYRHAPTLPFTRRLGTRTLRFSAEGIRRYLAARRPA